MTFSLANNTANYCYDFSLLKTNLVWHVIMRVIIIEKLMTGMWAKTL